MTRDMTRLEGLFVGGSGGAAVAGAIKYAKMMDRPMKILVFLCDGGQKYVSKIFNDDWMRENGFFDEAPGLGTVRDLLASRDAQKKDKIVTCRSTATLREVIDTMKSLSISQLPVVDDGKLRGIVGEVDLLRHLVSGVKTLESPIGSLAEGDYGTVTPDTKIELLQGVLADAKVAIVTERENVVAIVTKIDLIDYLAKQAPRQPSTPPSGPVSAPPAG
jgi:cystathionine beta-synthase